MLLKVTKNQVLDRIRFENPWWKSRTIEAFFQQMPRRRYFEQFLQLIEASDVRRAVVLMGPRRVGKTVMLQHAVQHLIGTGISPRKIALLTIENPIYNSLGLEELFACIREAAGEEEMQGWYVMFDEVQYLKNWDVHLKVLVDSYPGVKFVVSGSAAAALKYKSQESGAGRFSEFMLPPVTFYEYIQMQDLGHMLRPIRLPWGENHVPFFEATDIRGFNQLFVGYINFGGYPEAIFSEAVRQNPERFIRQDVIDKVLLRDLPGLYGISDVLELNALFTAIAYNTGQEFSLETLSQQSGATKAVIKKYLEYLEAAFLIRIVRRIDQTGKRFKRENFFKIYLTNPSLRSALFAPVEAVDDVMGAMAETAIFAQWMHRLNFTPFYARWGSGEVDMVGIDRRNLQPKWALEIKWSDRYVEETHKLKNLLSFCHENKLDKALVTTIHHHRVVSVQGVEVSFIPCSTYAYTVGLNTLQT